MNNVYFSYNIYSYKNIYVLVIHDMNNDLVSTFLAVVEHGSISEAAKYLYANQSNISRKIQQIEDELGVSLLIRSRGHRTIELTSQGKDFLLMARQWRVLWQDIQAVKTNPEIKSLSIGGVNLLNTFTFVPLYKSFIQENPSVQLSIHTYHSSEIPRQLETHDIDLGFAFSRSQSPNIISTPLYEESFCVLYRKSEETHDIRRTDSLDPSREIYLRWGAEYEHWHDIYLPGRKYRMRAGTGSMLADFLDIDGGDFWAIAPIDVARDLARRYKLCFCGIEPSPPVLKCYMLENHYSRDSRKSVVSMFKKATDKYIAGLGFPVLYAYGK